MFKRCSFVCLLLMLLLSSVAFTKELVLSSAGMTDYVIVLPKDAIPSEKRAAKELAAFLKQIGGAEFRIQDDSSPLPAKAILLGKNAYLNSMNVQPDWKTLGKEGSLLLNRAPHLVIAGGRPRGTMYGVYAFLEEKLGCRWYSSKISNIPKRNRIVIGDLNEIQVPALEYREPFMTDAFDADWASRNRCNSNNAGLTEEHGGKVITIPFVHSFYQLIPPDVYFKDHPDYFSEIGGQRTSMNAQLCLTNPEVLKLMIEKVKQTIQANPQASIVSVSQNDCYGPCQCAKCRAIDEAEGSPAGSLLTFVNAVAEAVEKEYPNIAIDTLAYVYTRKPPKTLRPRPNVIVRLCSIEGDFGQPLGTGARNKSFADDIRGWHRLCDRLYIWDYVTSFGHYLVPFPNLHVLGPNIRFFAENGVKGIFEEGAYGPGGGFEFNELREYMLAKLLWDPKVDDETVRQDFMNGVYGPAAKPIDEYLRLLQRTTQEKNIMISCGLATDSPLFTDELVAQSEALFDKAEKAVAGNQELLQRVRQARMSIDYELLYQSMGKGQATWQLTETSYAPVIPQSVTAAYDRFFETAKRVGLKCLNEGGHSANPSQVTDFYNRTTTALKGASVVWLKNEDVKIAFTPETGCRLLKVLDGKTGTERLTFSQSTGQLAGVPGYSETIFGNAGRNEVFTLDKQSGEYSAKLQTGLKVTRRVEAIPKGLLLRSKIVNQGAKQPLQVAGRFLFALAGQVKLIGFFGEKIVPGLTLNSPGNTTLTAAECAGQSVILQSAEGASVTLSIKGPFTGLAVGPGPDGLLSTTLFFEVPMMNEGDATDWQITVCFSETTAGARKSMPGVVELPGSGLSCYLEGTLSGRHFDPTTSEGMSSTIVGSTNEWALQWPYPPVSLFEPQRKYDVWAVVRVIGVTDKVDGVGLSCGVWNVANRVGKGQASLQDAASKPGQWQLVKISTMIPEAGEYYWFAPAKNPTVKEIQVDRILLTPTVEGK